MMLIQVILIALVLSVAIYFVTQRSAVRAQAGIKLLILVFTLVSVGSILYPEFLNTVAHWVGVGRGADLLLYGMIVMFVSTVLATYLALRERQVRLVRLTRHVVLLEKRLEELEGRAGATGHPAPSSGTARARAHHD